LHCLVKKQQTCATHSYNTLWCVFNAEVFFALSSFWTNNCKDIFDVIPSATSPFGAAVIH